MKSFKYITNLFLALALTISLAACKAPSNIPPTAVSTEEIPAYTDSAYVVLEGNQPQFTDSEKAQPVSFEDYSLLDSLGRCGVATACIGQDIMPTEERGQIGSVKPSGWQTVKYDFVDGKYLYNRCHLIGFQLTGENANEQNLITGTRYMNVEGMLPFENMVADYIKETDNHVLYRVTPIFEGNNLVASGVQMEAYSIEDQGDGICFNVYCYNVQPGVTIDYATGDSRKTDDTSPSENMNEVTYILNTSSKKIHRPDCPSVEDIAESNRENATIGLEELKAQGYDTCGNCF